MTLQKVLFTVLCTHMLILAWMWGGINALGCSVLLSVFIFIGVARGFYQMGLNKASRATKNGDTKGKFGNACLFRG